MKHWLFLIDSFQVTGGRSYAVTSHRVLHQCIDSLVQKLQFGVVINFDKLGPDPLPPPGLDKPEEEEGGHLARFGSCT